MEYKNILYSPKGPVAVVTIARPSALNALTFEIFDELRMVFSVIQHDAGIRCVVLTGEGKAFVAGADVKLQAPFSPEQARAWARDGQALLNTIERLDKPVIAAVNGYALGGGCELAMACDIRIASEKAVFGQPEIKLALVPGFGGTQRLPRLVGMGRAKELLFTGRNVPAGEALAIGLVNQVTPHEDLMDTAMALAEKLAAFSGITLTYIKQAVTCGMDLDLQRGLEVEQHCFALGFTTEDHVEGCNAFIEKREARFIHR